MALFSAGSVVFVKRLLGLWLFGTYGEVELDPSGTILTVHYTFRNLSNVVKLLHLLCEQIRISITIDRLGITKSYYNTQLYCGIHRKKITMKNGVKTLNNPAFCDT